MDMCFLLGRIWGYVYLQRCHSFVIFVYLNYIYGIILMLLLISFSLQCIVFLIFVPLYDVCVLCPVSCIC
jgi:hypothetical protein